VCDTRRVRRVVFGLGSNLGDRALLLDAAVSALAVCLGAPASACSPLYVTPPWGGVAQPDYLNAAVLFRSLHDARALFAAAMHVERLFGRERPDPVRYGPRTLDVDLLWIEGEHVAFGDLVVPHERLVERPFALVPLLDVAPDARDPRSDAAFADAPAARAPLQRFRSARRAPA
jgi:2-amino-4-hydroxy-6-hydroxymethyldihydropteridine diphosphokinase